MPSGACMASSLPRHAQACSIEELHGKHLCCVRLCNVAHHTTRWPQDARRYLIGRRTSRMSHPCAYAQARGRASRARPHTSGVQAQPSHAKRTARNARACETAARCMHAPELRCCMLAPPCTGMRPAGRRRFHQQHLPHVCDPDEINCKLPALTRTGKPHMEHEAQRAAPQRRRARCVGLLQGSFQFIPSAASGAYVAAARCLDRPHAARKRRSWRRSRRVQVRGL